MGSLCGKESTSSGHVPGPTLVSSRTSLLPDFMSKKPKVGGPGRTLGGSSTGSNEVDGEQSPPVNARVAAALAAEVIPLFPKGVLARQAGADDVPISNDLLLLKRAGNWQLSWSSRSGRHRINISRIGQREMDNRNNWFGTRWVCHWIRAFQQ